MDVEVFAGGKQGRDHVEPSFVVADGGRIDAAVAVRVRQIYLRGACQAGTDLLPVDEVFAVIDRHSGKILECAVHQIEVVARAAHAGVGMEARQHRVFEPLAEPEGKMHEDGTQNEKFFLHE